MKEYNHILERQLKRNNINKEHIAQLGNNVDMLLNSISECYDALEEDKMLLERSIEISSEEYLESIDNARKLQLQLISKEKMACIGQLSSGVAHEINNPLGFVRSNIEIMGNYTDKLSKLYKLHNELRKDPDNIELLRQFAREERIEYIFYDFHELISETIIGLDRIGGIVNSLLSFSRKGYSEVYDAYDLNKGIKDTLTVANNEIKNYAKVVKEFESIPIVSAMCGEINQVILSIIINSVDAIKEKSSKGIIIIHTYSDDNSVYCDISDNGIGISEINIKKIFDPFFTTKPVGRGTGLGLSIARDIIVNKHKGNIEVKSVLGEGATFNLSLPIVNIEEKNRV